MFVNLKCLFLVSNPFYQAYIHSDFLGKMIFLSLLATSVCCWTILVHKIIITKSAKKNSIQFKKTFLAKKGNPLNLENEASFSKAVPNPFFELYLVLKKQTVDILNKNRHFSEKEGASYLSPTDVNYIEGHLVSHIGYQANGLEKNLFILSIIVGLAPLLGLLGTVWGILITFSGMQAAAFSATNQAMLGGISLALTTTVLGLINAIPALIAHGYLKNAIRSFATEMEGFSNDMLAAVEMQYRQVDVNH